MRRCAGRCTQPGAEYFLTICTVAKRAGLSGPAIAAAVLGEARAMAADGTWVLRCLVIMPDHVHLLITLGGPLSIAKAVQRLKAKTSALLRSENLNWERGFFDRRLRPNDDLLPLFLYIYLNPYRANLLTHSEKWPHYHCRDEDWAWFEGMLNVERPMPEWLL